ncbi:sigma 54-interacting transcriptional regulator [Virgibacillus sp. NKC19-16]|uniref:sigma-54 interaction domain-containing protein n=1 Tax=Virgibacillus salidurans TaxID=2831673 RepID=UPI001F1ECBD8|nr:sigma 54-interacting transcriptional regulator [Virgibacillus sp. NKC19-16]UJL45492.1 sigma 54-interacting transcriptional regulator [Virgibacillus sp. NKC19-16]
MNNLNVIEKTGDWGYVETDLHGKITRVSADFGRHFFGNKKVLLGKKVFDVIQGINRGKSNKLLFGMISGYACLIRLHKNEENRVYHVVIRQDEADYFEMNSFLKTINSGQSRKKASSQSHYSFDDIIGESRAIRQVKDLAAKISISNSTVLLSGKSGTGKELFAQAIHHLSSRKNHPFIAVNCMAIPNELFESEIFGYEAGAFSGAKKEGKPGKIELAQHGTLFLDEISELTYQSQGKLLRVLQEREVERLGGTSSKNVDIRIIAATNKDLKALVSEGKFREDLFYRLFVFDLHIPSLKQRKDDIESLAYAFIQSYNEKLGQEVKFIDSAFKEWIVNYEWPGNVRELKAYIERGMNIVEGDTLTLDSLYLPSAESTGENTINHIPLLSLQDAVSKAEIDTIKRALMEADGDRLIAANLLKIHVASLYRKISKYNLK